MRTIYNLNKDWQFIKNCTDVCATEGAVAVDLPHTWNATDG